MSNRRQYRTVVVIAVVVMVLLLWEYSVCGSINLLNHVGSESCDAGNAILRLFLSSPSLMYGYALEEWDTITQSTINTGLIAISGIIISIGLSIAVASMYFLWPKTEGVLMPTITASQVVPFVVFAPLAQIAFDDPGDKVALTVIITFFPILSATIAGIRTSPRNQFELMKLLDANKISIVRHVIIPHCAHHFFVGLRMAAPFSVIGAIIAEVSAAGGEGLGKNIFVSTRQLNAELQVWSIGGAVLLSYGIYSVVRMSERGLGKWYSNNER